IAILGMGACSLVIGLTPTYESIGIAAAFIIVVARLLQGISAGGEAGSATTYLVEMSLPGRRDLGGSMQQISTGLSTLFALATSALLANLLTADQLGAWGWRIPFVIGAVLSVVGLLLRLAAHESPVFETEVKTSKARVPVLRSLVAN